MERRDRLLAAGLTLFSTQGYARTPIEQLCAEAKVTARHFYEWFESREALLTALYDAIIGELRESIAATLQSPDRSLEQQIDDAVQAMVQHYLADARRARIGVLEVVGVSAALEQRRRAAIHSIAAVIEHYANALVAQGRLPRHDYHLVSVAMVGGVNELLAEWLTAPSPPDTQVLADEVMLFFRALFLGAVRQLEIDP